MELTYDETSTKLDAKHVGATNTGYTSPPARYEKSEFNLMFESLCPSQAKNEYPN